MVYLPSILLSGKMTMFVCSGMLPELSEKRGTGGREGSSEEAVDVGADCAWYLYNCMG